MRTRLIAVCAVLALVAACETPTPPRSSTTGTGGSGETGAPTTPVATTALEVQQEIDRVGDTVFFGFDKYTLDARARATVQQQVEVLSGAPDVNIIIEGHTDERGPREYNLALGDRRANAVRDFMVSLGMAPTRIRTITYGEERPAVPGSNEAAWAQNRRAVTVVVGAKPGA